VVECNSGQVLNTHVPLSPSSIIGTSQWAGMPYGWEGNRRSGVALATHHTHQWFSTYGLKDFRAGDEHPPTLSSGVWWTLPLFTQVVLEVSPLN